jgi:hypothetical protein
MQASAYGVKADLITCDITPTFGGKADIGLPTPPALPNCPFYRAWRRFTELLWTV